MVHSPIRVPAVLFASGVVCCACAARSEEPVRVFVQHEQRLHHQGKNRVWQTILMANARAEYGVRLASVVDDQGRLVDTTIGLDHPQQPASASFWANGFLEFALGAADVAASPMTVGIREVGERGCLELLFATPTGPVRCRLLLLPDDPRLYIEWALDGAREQERRLRLVSFPAVWNAQFQLGGRRAVRTAARMVEQGETAVANPEEEGWALFQDLVWDYADPERRNVPVRGGVVGPGGAYWGPVAGTKVEYRPTEDHVEAVATYPAGTRLIRLAVVEMPNLGNEEGLRELQASTPAVQERLRGLVTTPLAVVEAQPAVRARAVTAALARLQARGVKYTGDLQNRLELWQEAREAWRREQEAMPVAADRRLLAADERLALELARVERLGRSEGRILAVRGLFSNLWALEEVARRYPDLLGERDDCLVRLDWNYGFYTDGFPRSARELMGYDAVLLADVDPEALREVGMQALLAYLDLGGGLVVLGGYYSYGLSSVYETGLGSQLPVQGQPFDLQPIGAPLQAQRGSPFTAGLRWDARPVSLWQHEVTSRPEGFVHISAGGHPFLVTRRVGSGRIAAFTGTVLGTPQGGQKPFWEWESWPELLAQVLAWAADKPLGR